jgi:hypothetical protein
MFSRGYPRARHGSARRLILGMTGLALALGALPALAGAMPGTAAVAAHADDVTASQDTMRTGWDQSEPAMGPSVVPTFVQRFATTVAGQVYAQPVVVGSTVVVVTENDYAYGLDATTGAIKWTNHLGNAFVIGKSSNPKLRTCHDLVPNWGATGTPVYDPGSGDVYFFTDVGKLWPRYYFEGIDPSTGTIVAKVRIGGHPSNDSHLSFNSSMEAERPGALLVGGAVYAAFASHCDRRPYTGYVVRVNVSTKAYSLWTDENGITYNRAGIWQSGGGIVADPQGRIFVTSGNGVSPAKASKPPGQLAESVIRLGVSGGKMSAQDFFSPANAPSLDAADTDFGAGGPAGLPFGTSSGSGQQMLVQGGKDGRLWLLDRGSLGGREQGAGNTDAALFWTKAYGGNWGHPAVFADSTTISTANNATVNDFVFNVGKSDPLRVFRVAVAANNKPVLSNVANSSITYGFSSGSPVVTSNGTDPSSAVIWVVHAADGTGAGGELDAYALGNVVNTGTPSPCSSASQCVLTPIWHASFGGQAAAKFSIPATSNGWVYVGTRGSGTAGVVYGYSVPVSTSSTVQSAATTLPDTSVSSTITRQVSVTARKPVTFTSVTATTNATNALTPANQFAVGQATVTKKGSTTAQPVTFPVTLSKGDELHVAVKFSPVAPGGADGSLTFTTSTHHSRIVPVTGTATKTGLEATPSSMTFPLAIDQGVIDVPVGLAVPQNVDIVNSGTTTETVSSVTPPSGPFRATGLPLAGDKITPGQSFVVQVFFAPTRPGPASGSFTITTASGRRVTVPLSGIGAPSVSKVTAGQATTAFGPVKVGTTVTRSIHITNNGNIPSRVMVPIPPKAPFHSVFHLPRGLPFNPDYDLLIPVTFTPTTKGTFTGHYRLVWKDRLGTHSLTVTLTGTGI